MSRTPRAGSPHTDQISHAIAPSALPCEPQDSNLRRLAPGNTGGLRLGERAWRMLSPLHVLLSSPGNSADPAVPAPQSPRARSSLSAPRMQPREGWGRTMRGNPRRLPAHLGGAMSRSFSPWWGRGRRRQEPWGGRGRAGARAAAPHTHHPGATGCSGAPAVLTPPPPRVQAQRALVLTGTDREEEGHDWTEEPRAPTQDLGVRKSETDGTGQAGPWKEVGSGPRELTPGPRGSTPTPQGAHPVCRRADTATPGPQAAPRPRSLLQQLKGAPGY